MAIIEAKNVRDPDCSPRTLDSLQQSPDNHQPWEKNIYRNDADEIKRYGQALGTPGSEAKFVEIDTSDPNSTGYWDYLLAKNHTKGYARHVP